MLSVAGGRAAETGGFCGTRVAGIGVHGLGWIRRVWKTLFSSQFAKTPTVRPQQGVD